MLRPLFDVWYWIFRIWLLYLNLRYLTFLSFVFSESFLSLKLIKPLINTLTDLIGIIVKVGLLRLFFVACLSIVLLIANSGCAVESTDVVGTDAAANNAPISNAGNDQNISNTSRVTLDGSNSSDEDGDPLSYTWSFTSMPPGSNAVLSNALTVRPTFTADLVGTYTLSLVVNDGTDNSAADTVIITAASTNSEPVANAGPDQNVSINSTVTLNGSGSSDADLDSLTYSWSITSSPTNSMATLSSTRRVNPTFVADRAGFYVLQLIVNDGTVDSTADTVTIRASSVNSAPVADAGRDQNVSVNSTVTLNGSRSSDADLDSLTYSWSMTTAPANSTATLSSTTEVNPGFVADREGFYVVQLIVNDGAVNSAADTVTITASVASPEKIDVLAVAETTPVPDSGDAADDPAIWVHPTDPSLSVIIGTNKLDGIAVYNLDGTQRQYISSGDMNNVDIRYGFSLGADSVDLVGMSNRTNDTLAFYKMDPVTRQISSVGSVNTSLTVYGFCMYKSGVDGKFYAFVNDKNGNVSQYELFDNSGNVGGSLVRSFNVGSITEGCVADDEFGDFYIGEENVGIWKYGAEPGSGSTRSSVDRVGNHLTADVEGLTIYYTTGGQGYLIASSQGSDEFVLYDRVTGDYLGSFKVVAGNGIDAVTGTDGIDVISTPLGSNFPYGLFVAQDTDNSGSNQNYKVVKWEDIAQGFTVDLLMETSWDPRN